MREDVVTGGAPGHRLFTGGGELGREMAARNWADTPLGPPETWPVGLRNAVRIVLTSRFAMWAAWGPELIAFYNDAYKRDTLQAKHPWALGRPASEMWAEIWQDIGPRIRSVLETGVATWDEDLLLFLERSGYPEETYHTFSYSPLGDDDDGRAEGMLCVVTETTQRVVGERRMMHLRDLAAATATTRTRADVLATVAGQLGRNAADLPFAAVYLVDDDGTARLGGSAGIGSGSPLVPATVAPGDPAAPWPLVRIRAGEQVTLGDLGDRFPGLPTGAWRRPPVEAVAVPIASGQDRDPVAGFLVVGLNPHRRYDDSYRGYLELIAGQISSGLLNAGSYEAERQRAEALAELDRAKTDFFSNVSHEFRTPLTLIMGPIAELRASPVADSDPRVREELDVVHRNALRLGRLVNTLLDFSRLQAGRIEARFEPVDLSATTAELASVFRSAVARAGLEFTVDCGPLDEPVHIDRDMWEKVVLNLLSNALKFTFEGGITVRIRQEDRAAVLTVADTGTGIPPEELPRLFERFHRVSDARARSGEGSGIGLAMVRELVTLHGGTVDVASGPDAGTTFTVTLPFGTAHLPVERLAPAASDAPAVSAAAAPFVSEALRWLPPAEDAPAEPSVAPADPSAAAEGGSRSGRVLVADDNADMREYLQRLLAPRYAVQTVPDGLAALQAAQADPPDLVVSDVMMPGLDGMQLLAELRRDARTSRVPVLLLSARAGQEAAVEGLSAGADDYLVKPFSAQELLARVSAHLHLGRARREAEERFTAMADLAPALIWVADPAGRRAFVNHGWTTFTGRSPEAESGDGWEEGLHPQDRERYRTVVAAAAAEGRGWEVEFRLRRDDGAYHWLLERAVPIGGGESFAGYVGSCTDINARYRETERQTLLAAVGATLDRETSVPDQLSGLARLVVDTRLAELCTVRVVDADGRMRIEGVAALDPATEAELAALDPETGLGVDVLEIRAGLLQTQVRNAAGSSSDDVLVGRLGVRSRLAVPLTVRGRVLAVLGLGRRGDAPPYNEDDRLLAEEIAARAALAVDNALLLADERAAALRLGLLQRATAELSAATTPEEVAVAAASHMQQLVGDHSRVGVYELNTAQRSLLVLTIAGLPAPEEYWRAIPLSAPLAVTAAVAERRPVWLETLDDWPGAHGGLPAGQTESLDGFGLHSTVALPLTAAGRVLGVIGIGFPTERQFPATERAMLLAIAEQAAQALDRARLYRAEQSIAETLQLSLLPQELPQYSRLALAAQYLPGAEGSAAGGDWYDVVELGGTRVAVAVGDVVGQGPAAAAVMGQLRSALSAALLQGCPPADALELLDRFASRLPGALASTAACMVLDWSTGSVRWARAGHPPPVLVTPEGARLLDEAAGAGPVLGVPERGPYREAGLVLLPGSTLLLYTDGLVERRTEHLDVGLDRLIAAAGRLAGTEPGALTRELLDELLADAAQPDDVAVLAARLLPPPLYERLPADPTRLAKVRRTVAGWAVAAGLPEEMTEDLQLALGEALANAVEHAYSGSEQGECVWSLERDPDGGLRVCVQDFGTWRPPPEDRGHRGRGLELISALGDHVDVGRTEEGGSEGTGTTVRFRLAAPAGPAAAERAPRADGGNDDGPVRVEVTEDHAGVRLAVSGAVDLSSAGPLRAELRGRLAALPRGAAVTVDLTRVSYLASAGVGLLLEFSGALRDRGIGVRLVTDPGSVPARVLALTRVDGSDPTRDEAR